MVPALYQGEALIWDILRFECSDFLKFFFKWFICIKWQAVYSLQDAQNSVIIISNNGYNSDTNITFLTLNIYVFFWSGNSQSN